MRSWLLLFLPLTALITAGFAGHGQREWRLEQAARLAQAHAHLELAERRLAETFMEAAQGLRVIAATPAVRRYAQDPAAGRENAASLFEAFVREDNAYESLLLFDAHGVMAVGVHRTAGGAERLPAGIEADAALRPAIEAAQSLIGNRIQGGRLRLQRSQGELDVPYRPVLDLSTRVAGGSDAADIVVVAQMRAALALKRLGDELDGSQAQVWLLDDQGYWILHPDPLFRWSRERDGLHRLDRDAPALVPLLERAQGQWLDADRLYVHRRVDPLAAAVREGITDDSPRLHLIWPLVAPAAAFIRTEDRWPLAGMLLLAAIGSAALARTRQRAAVAEQRERTLVEERARQDQARGWIREHVYQLSLQVHAARDPADFGRSVLQELSAPLQLVAGCLYALRADRAIPVASFGMSATPRAFAAGESLVGEAWRTREERHLCPPPAGYLDLSGGLGQGPAAELRILPLWVHGRTVGVIELAFAARLEPRQHELLRQVLPLLALNLDGFLQARG